MQQLLTHCTRKFPSTGSRGWLLHIFTMEFLFLSFNTSSDLYKYYTATSQTSTNSHTHYQKHTHTPINLNSSDNLNQNYISTLSPDCQNFHPVFGLGENLYSHTRICTPPKIMSTPLPTMKILHTQLFRLAQTIHTTAPSRLNNIFTQVFWTCTK
jgi:hypothetical protein